MKLSRVLFSLLAVVLIIVPAQASLTTFQTYTGHVAVSTDGFGSLSQKGTISASVPSGATVVAAYLYSASFNNTTGAGVGGTLDGTAVAYGPFVPDTATCCDLGMKRADVTTIAAAKINGGPGGVYNFTVTETSDTQDGEALVVVYTLASLPDSTVAILDGFSASGGDSFTATFSKALDPTDPGFFARMYLGDSFSCCDQKSTIKINGITITDNAGNNDDGDAVANGSLITVGGFDDPFSKLLPSYADDHEKYDLAAEVKKGDMSIKVQTNNPSNDDNIFLAVFHASGTAIVVNPIPEPATLMLLGAALVGLGCARFRKLGK